MKFFFLFFFSHWKWANFIFLHWGHVVRISLKMDEHLSTNQFSFSFRFRFHLSATSVFNQKKIRTLKCNLMFPKIILKCKILFWKSKASTYILFAIKLSLFYFGLTGNTFFRAMVWSSLHFSFKSCIDNIKTELEKASSGILKARLVYKFEMLKQFLV